MKRQSKVVLAVVVVSGVVCAAACFPEVTFSGGGGSGTASSSSSGTTSTVTTTSHATTSSSSTSLSSSSGGTGGGPCAKPCDCDNDGDNSNAPGCDGGDCDDFDPQVNSKQTMWFTVPSKHGKWDYNCDGNDEYEFPGQLACGPVLCDAQTQSWTSTAAIPSCGDAGAYGVCMGIPALCSEKILGMRVQGCH